MTVSKEQTKSKLAKGAILLRKGCYKDDGPKPSQFKVQQKAMPTERCSVWMLGNSGRQDV